MSAPANVPSRSGPESEMESRLTIKPELESNWLESIEYSAVLGSGAFGVVLKAIGPDSSISAVKIIVPNACTSFNSIVDESKEKDRILREYTNASQFQHENVVSTLGLAEKTIGYKDIKKIFDSLELDQSVYNLVAIYRSEARRLGRLESFCIRMELCGETLRSWLKKNEGKEMDQYLFRDQVGIVTGLIEGLKILHGTKIIHRDLKPENIYFSEGYKLPIKIGDFGLSRQVHSEDSITGPLTCPVGTFTYMAPEVNTNEYSFQADLYSLGLVIWEVLQLIREEARRNLFDRLVNDQEKSLIKRHPIIGDYADCIVALTRRQTWARTKSVGDIGVLIMNLEHWAEWFEPLSMELRSRLKGAKEGEVIDLIEGEYKGYFELKQSGVIILGKGERTVLSSPIFVDSESVACLRVIGNNCKVVGVAVRCFNFKNQGIYIQGSYNKLEDIQFDRGNSEKPLRIIGDYNEVSNMTISYAEYEILVEGNCNRLKDIRCHNTRRISQPSSVHIQRGDGNVVENLQSLGPCRLYLYNATKEASIRDSVCHEIILEGSYHKFLNVVGHLFKIKGIGHLLKNCKGQSCVNEGTSVNLIDCALDLSTGSGHMGPPQAIKPKPESDWLESLHFEDFLGVGSYGVVLKARDNDQTTTAVKIIVRSAVGNEEESKIEIERISREYTNANKLNHKNVVRTLTYAEKTLNPNEIEGMFKDIELEEAHEAKDRYIGKARRIGGLPTICIQMELCGKTLRSWLIMHHGKEIDQLLFWDQVGVIKGLVEGLKILHQNKIIHRDFKPENIYFSEGYSLPVKIGDFGLSRHLHNDNSKTSTLTSIVGTYDYMAPEAHTNDYSFQADIYSLGLVIWEVLQLIRQQGRRNLFDKLVNDKNKSLIEPHPIIFDYSDCIVEFTSRKTRSRTKSMEIVEEKLKKVLDYWKSEPLSRKFLHMLKDAKDGDVIELEEGKYLGHFDLKPSRVVIRGKGVGTIIRSIQGFDNWRRVNNPCLQISGSYCKVTGVKLICDGYCPGIFIQGSCNTLENSEIEGSAITILEVVGDENKANNLNLIMNHRALRIRISGSRNELRNIQFYDYYDHNLGIPLFDDERDLCTLRIFEGDGNIMENIMGSTVSVSLDLSHLAKNAIIRDSIFNKIYVNGSCHTFDNVGGKEIRIKGIGHRLDKCKAEECTNEGTNVSLVDCHFRGLATNV